MTIAIALYVREPLRSIALPLATAIGEGTSASDVLIAVNKFRELVGDEIFKRLDKVFNEALSDEIFKALNTDDLEHEFSTLVEKFWARLALLLVELSTSVYTNKSVLKALRSVEEELAKAIAKALKLSGYEYADNLVYALSALVDRDLWIIDKVAELSFEELVKKLTDRALDTVIQLAGYTMYLAFAWISASVAVIGIAKKYRERNRDMLATWCREYAREVEEYLDTLDLLLDDEVYNDLRELRVIER